MLNSTRCNELRTRENEKVISERNSLQYEAWTTCYSSVSEHAGIYGVSGGNAKDSRISQESVSESKAEQEEEVKMRHEEWWGILDPSNRLASRGVYQHKKLAWDSCGIYDYLHRKRLEKQGYRCVTVTIEYEEALDDEKSNRQSTGPAKGKAEADQ